MTDNELYVYIWLLEGRVIYIGKGTGDRYKSFKARRSKILMDFIKGRENEIKASILVGGMCEEDALLVEQGLKNAFENLDQRVLDFEHNMSIRKSSQRKGLDAMPMVNGKRVSAKTGGNFGVPPIPCPEFESYYKRVKAGELGVNQAIKELHIGVSKWYRLCEYKERAN